MRGFVSISLSNLLAAGQMIWPESAVAQRSGDPVTPIRHIVVIFDENISFDHYFGIYPHKLNPSGEPRFHARENTPTVNGLTRVLREKNPNLNPANGTGGSNPLRLDRSQPLTADQNHECGPEQGSFDSGLMDLFPNEDGIAWGAAEWVAAGSDDAGVGDGLLRRQHSDGDVELSAALRVERHSYNTNFGSLTPGAINLISGRTNGVIASANGPSSDVVGDGNGGLTLVSDADPLEDVCSSPTRFQAEMGGKNIGDLLSTAGVTWGWFAGGFNLNLTNAIDAPAAHVHGDDRQGRPGASSVRCGRFLHRGPRRAFSRSFVHQAAGL